MTLPSRPSMWCSILTLVPIHVSLANSQLLQVTQKQEPTLEPLVRVNHPPNHHRKHRRPPYKTCPVHQTRSQIASVTLDRHRIGIMSAVKHVASVPITGENCPKCHGPRRKRWPTKNARMVIGTVKATKAAIAAMAPIATIPPKTSVVRQMPITVLNHTAWTGVWVYLLTLFQMRESGKQSSRA